MINIQFGNDQTENLHYLKISSLTYRKLQRRNMTDNKQRYSFNDDKTLIRANQGHSIPEGGYKILTHHEVLDILKASM